MNTKDMEFEGLSATRIAAGIRLGEFSSRDAVEHFIARLVAVNPKINALVIDFFDEARTKADEADRKVAVGGQLGRLHGVPFTIKECFDYIGTPSTLGVLARKADRPSSNDPYIDALMREGGIVLGKTNVPQLLIFIESINRIYGRTLNPLNPKFTCGGSSGGEGAVVGAGASPVGIGSDIGGSVRFPAAFCGACSIKPTMWRTPDLTRYGDTALTGPINSVTGVIANHAEDLWTFLSVINESAGSEKPLHEISGVDLSALRIGWYDTDGIFEPMPAVKRAVSEAAERLRSGGAEVVQFNPPSFEAAEEIFYRILTVNGGEIFTNVLGDEKALPQIKNSLMLSAAGESKRSMILKIVRLLGQRHAARMIPFFGGRGEEFLEQWSEKQSEYRSDFLRAMDEQRIDAILGPISPVPAFLHDSSDKIGLGGTYSLIYNMLGFPAGIARVSTVRDDEAVGRRAGFDLGERSASKAEAGSAGMPLAVQIAARPWREDIVLALIERLHKRNQANC